MATRPRHALTLTFLVAIVVLLAFVAGARAAAQPSGDAKRVLVIYTHSETIDFGQAGRLYAIMLRNLIGHFTVDSEVAPLEAAKISQIAAADAVFFIGFIKDRKLPPEFVQAMLKRTKPTVWLGSGIDQAIAADTGGKLGIAYVGKAGFDRPVPASGENPGFLDTIDYKGLTFTKHYAFDANSRTAQAEPNYVVVRITNSKRAQTVVEIRGSRSGTRAPFAVRSGAFWFFAELPFTYAGPRDRYLIFADLLFDILGTSPSVKEHRALVRLEDVHPFSRPSTIDRLSEYFQKRKVPFSVAVIPYYRDPNGLAGRPLKESTLEDIRSIPLVEALKRAVARGGSIVQHGTTHQFGTLKNPNSGISGDDFEFWDVPNGRPIPELESEAVVRERLLMGKAMLERLGLKPFAFEVPHYQGSPLAYRVTGSIYPATYQRVTYYSNEQGKVGTATPSATWVGQEFPFVIKRDHYGQLVLPENIGNLQYTRPVQSVDDLLRNADYAKTVRDGFASFFFHPFLLEGPDAEKAMGDLDRLVGGLRARGFRFVAADGLARETEASR